MHRHQDVGGLEVAVDDPLLVGVLHRPADQDEQLQPLGDRELLAVAVVGDRDAADQLHDEVGPARFGVVPPSKTWAMLGWSIIARAWRSASKRAMTCFVSIPGLMIFSATLRRTGWRLLGHVDDAHAPLADLLQQLVGADDRAGALGQVRPLGCGRGRRARWRATPGSCAPLVDMQQGLQPARRPRPHRRPGRVGFTLRSVLRSSGATWKMASSSSWMAFIGCPSGETVRPLTNQCEFGA